MRTRITRVFRVLAVAAALAAGLVAVPAVASSAKPAVPATPACGCQHHVMAYVAVSTGRSGNVVVPLDTVTGARLKPIPVGSYPSAVVVSPDGRFAYVADALMPFTVTVISTRTGTVVKSIPIPGPQGMGTYIGITPDGKTVYVSFGTTVVPIRTADYKVLKPIATRVAVTGLVFTPDDTKLFVNSWNGMVVPISTAANTAGKPIVLPSYEVGIASGLAITPDGTTLYAASGSTLTPISTATDTVGKPIRFAEQITNVVLSKDGRTAYVSNLGTYAGPGKLFQVSLATGVIMPPITLPGVAGWMVLTPDGKTLYAMEQLTGTVTAIRTATGTVLREIKTGWMQGGAVTPDGRIVYILRASNSVLPIRTATNTAGAAIVLTGGPTAIAFFRR